MGHDDMTDKRASASRSDSLRRGALTLIVAAALYEAVARSGYFPSALTPTLGSIAHTLFASLLDGTMLFHAAATLYRVVIGFGCAIAIGLPLGVMMGRFRPVENFVLPLTSALMPIPSRERALFWKVIIQGASQFIIAGLRQSFLRSWIAVIGAEMLAGSDWGLGWVIFDAKQFLDTDMMLASLLVIGGIGFATERLVFGSVERATIYRWGMAQSARG
jgi:NitT/TauT family transport system permease protein